MGQSIQQTVVQYNTGQVLVLYLLLRTHDRYDWTINTAVVQYNTGKVLVLHLLLRTRNRYDGTIKTADSRAIQYRTGPRPTSPA